MPKILLKKNKKKKNLVKNKFANTGRVELLLAKIPIRSNLERYLRRKKNGALKSTSSKSGGSSVKVFNPIRTFLSLRKDFIKKVLIASFVCAFIFICFSFIRQYNGIEFSQFLNDDQSQSVDLNNFGPEYNVLISGFQKISTNNFAQMLLLVSLNSKTGSLKVLAINPTFITTSPQTGKKYTLKTLINNVGSNDPMTQYQLSIENFLGIRIDRYIAFDEDQFKEFLSKWDFSMKSIDSFNASTGFIANNSTLKKTSLGEYIFTPDTKTGYDGLINRQLSFFTQFIENNRNIFLYLKAFWSSKDFTDVFHTDMSKSEMSSFLSALMSSNLPAKTTLIDSSLGVNSNTGTEDGLSPNFLEFDVKIKDIMLDIDIVKEQANIEVYNASSVTGLASKVKRIFQNMGANVISTNNYPEKVQGIKLYVPNKNPENFPNNIAAIETYFGNKLEVIVGDYKYNYTGDLILVLGEN